MVSASGAPRRVLAVVSSRAEYSRYLSVFRAIRDRSDLDLILVAAGQIPLRRHGLALEVLRADGFEPDEVVFQTIEGENSVTMGRGVGLTIIDQVSLLARHRPDWVLVMGDRFEALALTVAAAMTGMRIAHIQGGEVTGSVDESIRHAITKFSHLHFAANELAAEVIRRLGELPASVLTTGCPSVDLISQVQSTTRADALALLATVLKRPIDLRPDLPLAVVIYHPITTREAEQGRDIGELTAALEGMEATRAVFWPNIDAGADKILDGHWRFQRQHRDDDTVLYLNNFDPSSFMRLLANADLLVGNSSAGIREACYYGTPVVNVGDRQQGRMRPANVLDVGIDAAEIRAGIDAQLSRGRFAPEHTYGTPGAGQRVAEALACGELPDVQKTIYYPDLLGSLPAQTSAETAE